MSLSCVHRIYRCFFVFRSLSSSFFFCSPPVGWRSTLLNKDNGTDLYASRVCAFGFLLLTIPAKTSRSIWTECFVTKWNECKISNNQMIYPFCTDVYVEFVCQSHTVFSSLLLLQNEWKKNQNRLIDRRDKQERSIQKKFVTFTDIFRFIVLFLFLVLFSPIEFFLVGDFISSLVFFCAMLNLTSHFESMNYATIYCGSQLDCLRLCACVCLFIRSIIYALKPDTLHLLAVVTFFSLYLASKNKNTTAPNVNLLFRFCVC